MTDGSNLLISHVFSAAAVLKLLGLGWLEQGVQHSNACNQDSKIPTCDGKIAFWNLDI